MELARGKYRSFNDHHLTEKLVEEEGIEVCREKVRQILRSKGIAADIPDAAGVPAEEDR